MAPKSTRDEAQPVVCDGRKILPIRYALSSTAAGSSECALLQNGELEQLENYHYTLRTLGKGYIFINYAAMGDEVAVFEARNGGFIRKDTGGPAPSPAQGCLCVPKDVTAIKMCYLRLPDLSGTEALEEPWAALLPNMLSSGLMQEITLDSGKYDAPLSETARFIEEFKTENAGWLGYMGDEEPISKLFNRKPRIAPQRHYKKSDWEYASGNADKSYNVFSYKEDTIAVALHDSLGHIYDCVSLNACNLRDIEIYKKWHAPAVAHSAILDYGILGMQQFYANQYAEEVEKNERIFKLLDARYKNSSSGQGYTLQSAQNKMLDERRLTELNAKYPPSWREPLSYKNQWPVPHLELNSIVTGIVHKKTGTAPAVLQGAFKRRAEYIEKYRQDLNALNAGALKLTRDWAALMGSDKKHALAALLAGLFKNDEQILDDPGSLTILRGEIFAACHAGMSDAAGSDAHIHSLVTENSAYTGLLDEVFGSGGKPGGEFADYLVFMQPFLLATALSKGIDDPALSKILNAAAKRLGLDEAVTFEEKTLQEALPVLAAALGSVEDAMLWHDQLAKASEADGAQVTDATQAVRLLCNFIEQLYDEKRNKLIPLGLVPASDSIDGGIHLGSMLPDEAKIVQVGFKVREKAGLHSNIKSEKIETIFKAAPTAGADTTVPVKKNPEFFLKAESTGNGKKALEPLKRYALAASGAGAVVGLINSNVFIQQLFQAQTLPQRLKAGLQLLGEAVALGEIVFGALRKAAAGSLLRWAGGPIFLAVTGLEVYEALAWSDYDRAAGLLVSGGATATLALLVAAKMKIMVGLGFAGVPLYPLLIATALAGLAVSILCSDGLDEEILKNNLFTLNHDPGAGNPLLGDNLENSSLPRGLDDKFPAIWADAKKTVEKWASSLFEPGVCLGRNDEALYFYVDAPNFTFEKNSSLKVEVFAWFEAYHNCHNVGVSSLEINEKHLMGELSEFKGLTALRLEGLLSKSKIAQDAGISAENLKGLYLKVEHSSGIFNMPQKKYTQPDYDWLNRSPEGEQRFQAALRRAQGKTCVK